ncbi:MAG: hypothetical protein KGL39_03585 [Patescibacteria group bacterium]|nr:hypothetical protein [Patescibacteria group bacterium]
MLTINQQEARAFYTHCALLGYSTAEACAELGRTTWPNRIEDLAFGRSRHTPTIRRLAKPLLARLDEDRAKKLDREARKGADRERWGQLDAQDQADIFRALCASGGNEKNRRARDLAQKHGITFYAETIDLLRELVIGRSFVVVGDDERTQAA